MACLDTTVFLDLMGRGSRASAASAAAIIGDIRTAQQEIVTTRFTFAELHVGVERSDDPMGELARVQAALEDVPILEFGEPAALLFAAHAAHLRRIGRPAGDMDVLIAATAMARGHSLVTRNTRHFADILGLDVRGY